MNGPLIVTSETAKIIKERREMRSRLAPFIKKTFQHVQQKEPYLHNWHIDCLAEYLEACYKRQIRFLVVNIPPRAIKSVAGLVAFPAWILGKDPSDQILAGSCTADLAIRDSVYCRSVMNTEWYKATFPDVEFARDQNAKGNFKTKKNGHRWSMHVGAGVGPGGNFLLLDDPVNPLHMDSPTIIQTTNDWIEGNWLTRLNNAETSGVSILFMQRVGVNDPSAFLLERGYEHLCIQQEAEKRTVITFPISGKKMVRPEGHLMHEARVSNVSVERLKKNAHLWAGQQQQQPVPKGGGLIKLDWFRRYREIAPDLSAYKEIVFSMDTASGGKKINNPTVLEVYGRIGIGWDLLDVWKKSVRWPELLASTKNMATLWKPDTVLIENKSSGQSLIQELEDDPEFKPAIVAIEPEADKITRMNTQTPSIENGLIALPDKDVFKELEWVAKLELNLMGFPKPREFDEIDAMSQFIKWTKKREDTGGVPNIHSETGKSYWKSR